MIRDTSAQDRPLTNPPAYARYLVSGVVGILALSGVVLAWSAVQRAYSTNTSVSSARLTIATVERGQFVRDIAGEGKVVAAVSPTLYAPNNGAVTLRVHPGDKVTKGQVLAVVDSPDLNARLAQERSNADAMLADAMRADVDAREQRSALQAARDNASLDRMSAANDLARQQKAFDAGAVAGMQVDHAKDTLEKARITLDHAGAGLKLKEDSLRFDVSAKRLAHERQVLLVKDLMRQVDGLTILSPVDGQVGQLFVAEHGNVSKDAQLLSVIDLSRLEVQMQVAESFARDLAIGMPGEIGGNGQTWKGLVSAVSPEVVNNEVSARLRFDGATPEQLRQNQRLTVRVLLDRRDDVLTVQRGSFVDESGGAYAYIVRGGIAEKTPIKIGARNLDKVEILSGLAAGDHVVIAGSEAFQGAPKVALSQ